MFHRDINNERLQEEGAGGTCGGLRKGAAQTGSEPTRLFHLQ